MIGSYILPFMLIRPNRQVLVAGVTSMKFKRAVGYGLFAPSVVSSGKHGVAADVGEFADAAQDVLLLDPNLPDGNGIDFCSKQ